MKIIDSKDKKLNSTEGSILNLINTDPDFFCSHSIQEVSKQSNVSPSTMTRVCQKLGFKSFKSTQMFVYEKSRMQNDYYKLGDDNTIQEIIHNVRGAAMYTINETLNSINSKEIEEIAKRIYSSKRVMIFGLEQQQISANSFVLNLSRINIMAQHVSNIHNYVQRTIFFDENDFAIFITRTGWTKEIIESIKWSYNKNIPMLVLTADREITIEQLEDSIDISNIHIIETQTINNDKIKYPSISSVPGEMIIFDLIFNIIVSQNEKFRDMFKKTAEISLNWNFEGKF
ncbi:MurR/RpiR family transcriptional regulator [Spiroplasma diminutum]|uniref:RpiR family transcriptional regulator n=1 Tax=Spiroplasma diminutum CUAS-1 TaxID=1276221 RepID=S5LWZ9_9MOLU|nr:MurR/RpiR family transcriptional regulator [Spiroplasma diminutum]AGR42324.1 RpiR family transcriptional regulator [Spiroplasma diminutum CUAS-1]